MKTIQKMFIVALAAATVVACGGDDDPAEGPECGENTMEEDGACVPEYPEECGEGEVRDEELGDCVPDGEQYCGEGTQMDPHLGVCVAGEMECGEDTVEDGDECVPAVEISCGEGTIAFQGECVVEDDVCGEGTEWDEDVCRPTGDICGEGTFFDFRERVCVPESTLSCGQGTTTTEDFVCVATSTFYEELAESPDLDLDDEEAGTQIELGDTGESVVFTGTIEAPEEEDGELVQDEDRIEFEADAGQWLRVTVYSLGLPEPGFVFSSLDSDYYRLSDEWAGLEVVREFAIPEAGTQTITVSNMPQLIDELPPAGGEDWGYVGRIETMETPEAKEVDILDDDFAGDIRDLSDNFYHVSGADDVEAGAMFFAEYPADAEAELQVWADEETYLESATIDGGSIAVDTSEESFYLLFDRVHAFGTSVDYEAHIEAGESAAVGETVSEEVSLEAGEYVGLFQDNLDELSLSAAIYDEGGDALVSTNSLEVSTAEEGRNSLYWYAAEDIEVTLEVDNSSGQDIDFMVLRSDVGTADQVDGIDGDLIEVDYGESLARGQRHYYELEVEFDELLSIGVDSLGTAHLGLYDEDENLVEDGTDLIMAEVDLGAYLLVVEAESAISGGFTLELEESQIFEVSETSEPNLAIPDDDPVGVDDTIEIDTCPTVKEISADVEIPHEWRGDLIVRLSDPGGQEVVLKARPGTGSLGDSSNDIIGNFNETLEPVAGEPAGSIEAEPISVFEGTSGSGGWTMNVSDNAFISTGTLASWTLHLTCEG